MEAYSYLWFPGSFPSESFLTRGAKKCCPEISVGQHIGNALGDRMKTFQLSCMSQERFLCSR